MAKRIFRAVKGFRLDDEEEKRLNEFLKKKKVNLTEYVKNLIFKDMDEYEAKEAELTWDEGMFYNCILNFMRKETGQFKVKFQPMLLGHLPFSKKEALDFVEKTVVTWKEHPPETIKAVLEMAKRCREDDEYWKNLYLRMYRSNVRWEKIKKEELKRRVVKCPKCGKAFNV